MTPSSLGRDICARLDELGRISADADGLTRVFMSQEQAEASALVRGWMDKAGMTGHIDAIGNVIGRYEGDLPGLPALMLGSHLDTVRNAGRYDGMLGVVTAIACVGDLARRGIRLPFAIEVAGFSDEEGTRFGSTLLGSRALAGTFEAAALDRRDDSGATMREAMAAMGFDPESIATAARKHNELLAYLELHIEQGPVLESRELPVGCVTSISGSTRIRVTLDGMAGHAGTVPMNDRKDALAAAAAAIVAVEAQCAGRDGLVGTVGRIEAHPGAVNVIPGHVVFTIDVRAPDDAAREDAVSCIQSELDAIMRRRGITMDFERFHESAAAPCDPWLMAQIDNAIVAQRIDPFHLPSGAGHDGMAIKAITDIGMIFLRCAGGISHNPAESITPEDAGIGAAVLLHIIENFQPKP